MKKIIPMGHNKATKKMRKSETFSRFEDKKIRQNDYLDQVQYLQHNVDAALRLQIDNLVLTYGITALRKAVRNTDLKTIQKCKKVA